MSHDTHITWDELFAVAWHRLEAGGWTGPTRVMDTAEASMERVAAATTDHLAGCARCRAELAELVRFARGLVVAGDVSPDVAAINRALSQLRGARSSSDRAAAGLGARIADGLREIVATLVADSLRPSAAVRGAVSASPRLLVYDTDAYAISVSADREADRCVLRGQVTPTAADELPPRRTVTVRASASSTPTEADLNEFGEFVFDALPWGEFELTFTLGSDRVHIPPFRIDEQA